MDEASADFGSGSESSTDLNDVISPPHGNGCCGFLADARSETMHLYGQQDSDDGAFTCFLDGMGLPRQAVTLGNANFTHGFCLEIGAIHVCSTPLRTTVHLVWVSWYVVSERAACRRCGGVNYSIGAGLPDNHPSLPSRRKVQICEQAAGPPVQQRSIWLSRSIRNQAPHHL
ncbi:hypothetical protein [Mycobacterium sp. 1164985.4]|uniref:hypothetical protein n=1 Tax=Mycobacterium sp. 1164985.4 TaxID=1834069 RepID=UPI0018D31837|nr:hypothetical protein [Mycobacterium sp. 1164985.4]